jgi:glycosyltransferase involved in cell wall biosynthesis
LTEPSTDLPKVTAVVPVYNVEQYVERSLNTALAQTYPALTVLAVDDGSTDGSLDVCRRLAASSPRLQVVSGPNRGVAAARNRGTELAQTEYVAYLDADDLWHPDKITRQVEALLRREQGGDWAACYCYYRLIDENDDVIRNGPSFEQRGAFFAEHLTRNQVGNGSSLLVRRDAALELGGFDSSYVRRGLGGCEDFDFQLKLLSRYKMELVPEHLVGYRQRGEQMSADHRRMGKAYIAVVEKFSARPGLSPSLRHQAIVAARGHAALTCLRGGDFAGFAGLATANLRTAPLASLTRAVAFLGRYGRDKIAALSRPRMHERAFSRTFSSFDPAQRTSGC